MATNAFIGTQYNPAGSSEPLSAALPGKSHNVAAWLSRGREPTENV